MIVLLLLLDDIDEDDDEDPDPDEEESSDNSSGKELIGIKSLTNTDDLLAARLIDSELNDYG